MACCLKTAGGGDRVCGMSLIRSVHAREVLDSRGRPTVEVEVQTASGDCGRAIVPSGASTGSAEAFELRDRRAKRHGGWGVLRAVRNVNAQIAPRLRGQSVLRQQKLDRLLIALDGTPNKRRLGANAILGVSMAVAHAAAAVKKMPLFQYVAGCFQTNAAMRRVPDGSPHGRWRPPLQAGNTANSGASVSLPLPMINMISGGLHAGGQLDFQDFLVMPLGAKSIREALEWTSEIYEALRRILERRGHIARLVADEGGFGPRLRSNEEALRLLTEAVRDAGFRLPREVAIAVDVASTHFYSGGRYRLASENRLFTAGRFVDFLERLCDRYPIVSLEDPLGEEDWDGWEIITRRLGGRVQLIGDDLFATRAERLRQGLARGVANAVLIKVNQVGTLTETWETLDLARRNGYRTILSARSGETEDATMSDLAVGWDAGQIKIGSITRSERLAKYNQLLRIEERMGGIKK